jgi:hypothetical protein
MTHFRSLGGTILGPDNRPLDLNEAAMLAETFSTLAKQSTSLSSHFAKEATDLNAAMAQALMWARCGDVESALWEQKQGLGSYGA